MSDMLVKNESLATVANAIREKGGMTGQLVFPDGFVEAICDIGSRKIRNIDFGLTAWTKKNPFPSREYLQGTYDLSSKTLKGYVTGGYQHVVMVTSEKIDFFAYDALNFTYDLEKSLIDNGAIIAKISTSNSDPTDSTCVVNRRIYDAGTNVNVTIDVSSIDGSYYLWIGLAAWGDLGTVNFEVSNLHLK